MQDLTKRQIDILKYIIKPSETGFPPRREILKFQCLDQWGAVCLYQLKGKIYLQVEPGKSREVRIVEQRPIY